MKQIPLYNGIEAELIVKTTGDLLLKKHQKRKIAIATALADYYEFDTIAKAVAILRKKYGECELHIFGEGPKQAEVEQLARKNPRVVYHGFVDHRNVMDFLRNEAEN